MQQHLLPTPPTCTLEQILPSKQHDTLQVSPCCLKGLHSWHTLQSVLFPHQWGSATIFLLPQHIPDCYIPCAKCLPPAKPICTARYILHTAPVCSTPSRHPPHHSGAAQWYAGDNVPCSHQSSERQRGHHGYGGWDHYGHVSRYPADCPLPNSCRPPSSHCAHISGSRNAHLQLPTPSVVITCKCLRMELCGHILDIPQLVLQVSCLN